MGWGPLLTYRQIDRIFSENDKGQFLALCKYMFRNACIWTNVKIYVLLWTSQSVTLEVRNAGDKAH